MVTDSNGKAVNDIDRFCIELLPGASSEIKQHQEQSREPMEPTVQTAAAEQVWHVSRHAQEGACRFKVAAKAQPGHQARRDDFGIAHLLLRVFGMADRIQEICTQAIHG
jgi:hypothetical protein